jgi:hypothetical protein
MKFLIMQHPPIISFLLSPIILFTLFSKPAIYVLPLGRQASLVHFIFSLTTDESTSFMDKINATKISNIQTPTLKGKEFDFRSLFCMHLKMIKGRRYVYLGQHTSVLWGDCFIST